MTNQVARDERIRLYGRESQVEQVGRSRAPVTLILGDSGIGKSAVLTSAQMHSRRGAIAPAPRTITRSGAALQNALLQSLADAVAEVIAVDGNAKHVASLVADAAKRLARDRGQELAKVIGKELLNLIRGRIGEGAGDVIGAYVLELKTSVDEQLTSRITAAIDPGVVGLLIQFAAEVCALAGERHVFLALDSGERLREEDVRLLADIAETLPSHLRLRVALSTHDVSQREKADYLVSESHAIAARDVDPLGLDAISEWLTERGLDPVIAPDVERLSGGYALHVGDLIEHLRRGGEIEEAPLNEQFAKRTREAWRALDPQSAANARAISVFTDPLPAD